MVKLKFYMVIGLMVTLLFFTPVYIYGAVNLDFTPRWRVGDSWKITMRSMLVDATASSIAEESGGYAEEPGEPKYIYLKVTDLKEIDKEMCYIIEATYDNPTNEYDRNAVLQLYIRQDDFTLKRVAKITQDLITQTPYIDNSYDNDYDFVLFDIPFNVLIPCDFPNFPATNTDEERTIKIPSGLMVTQKVIFMDTNTVKIELSTKFGTRTIKTTQIWERGKPWWSSCKREFGYKDYETGEIKSKIESDPLLVGTDLTPPELTLSVTPTTLWPPNHEMVEITPTTTVTDNYDRFSEVKLYSVESNEPDDAIGEGDGHTTRDIQTIQVWDDKQHKMADKILLRAERDGKGNGRVYTITYTATDFSGNTTRVSATVTVPHDMGKEKK